MLPSISLKKKKKLKLKRREKNKMSKIKDKERILKAEIEKQLVTYKGAPIRLSADFSTEILQARRAWQEIFEMIKSKDLQPRLPSKAMIQNRKTDKELPRQE